MTTMQPPVGSMHPSARFARGQSPVATLRKWAATREIQLVVVTVAIFAVTGAHASAFFSVGNISFLLADAMAVAVMAVGQTIVILTRGIDLSVAPILGTSALAVGFLAQTHGLSPLEGLPLALGIGALLGVGNGAMVALARIPPIIATLGTLAVYGGVQAIVAHGQEVVTLPPSYFSLGNNDIVDGIPYLALVGAGITLLLALMLWRTQFGRSLYAVGNNEEAARRAGISVRRVIMMSYVLCGALAGLAGLIFLAHVGSADSTTGTDINIELTAIAGALIGGSTLTGGKGGVIGSFLAAIFLEVALAALVNFRINPIWEPAGVGVLIIVAMLADPTTGRPSMRAALTSLVQRPGGRG